MPKRRPQGGGYKQAKRLPYKHSSANLLAYDYTTYHGRIDCTAFLGFATRCPGASKSSTAIPIAAIAADNKRRCSGCGDAIEYVGRF